MCKFCGTYFRGWHTLNNFVFAGITRNKDWVCFFRRHVLEKEAHLQHEKRQFENFAKLIFAVQKCFNLRSSNNLHISRKGPKNAKISFANICPAKICTLKVDFFISLLLFPYWYKYCADQCDNMWAKFQFFLFTFQKSEYENLLLLWYCFDFLWCQK